MNNSLLHLIIGSNVTATEALNEKLKGYEVIEALPGYWLIKANLSPAEFKSVINSFMGTDRYILFRTDASVVTGGAIFPESVQTFLGSKQVAA